MRFEVLSHNSFEQLHINYSNERLQNYFNNQMFKNESKLYEREGIKVEFKDTDATERVHLWNR